MSPTYEVDFSDGRKGHLETEGNRTFGWSARYGILDEFVYLVDGLLIVGMEAFRDEEQLKSYLREVDGIEIGKKVSDLPDVYSNRSFGAFIPIE